MASIESYLATVDKVFPIDVDLTPYEKGEDAEIMLHIKH